MGAGQSISGESLPSSSAIARPRVSINSLPEELILHILDLGTQGSLSLTSRYEDYIRASRISLCWREPAQSLLWSMVFIRVKEQAEKLLSGGAIGKFRTKRLVIQGNSWYSGGVTPELAVRVLERMVGLKDLDVMGFYEGERSEWTFEMFGSPNLADLNSLRLDSVSIRGDVTLPLPNLAFQLDTLHVKRLPAHTSTLFILLSGSNLRELCLDDLTGAWAIDGPQDTIKKTLVLPSLPNLSTLRVRGRPEDVLWLTSPYIPSFKSLATFELECKIDQFLPTLELLSAKITTLIIRPYYFLLHDFLIPLNIAFELPALSELTHFYFGRRNAIRQLPSTTEWMRSRLENVPGGLHLLDLIDAKGIKADFDDVY